jgi:hypothetical protein
VCGVEEKGCVLGGRHSSQWSLLRSPASWHAPPSLFYPFSPPYGLAFFNVQAVPYWVDDESVRPSMLLSAPPARSAAAAAAAAAAAGTSKGNHVAVEVIEEVSHNWFFCRNKQLALCCRHQACLAPL